MAQKEQAMQYTPGLYGDASLGSDHVRARIADLLEDACGVTDKTREILESLAGGMPDDAWDEDEAQDLLNESEHTPRHCYWGYDDNGMGFGLWEDGNEPDYAPQVPA